MSGYLLSVTEVYRADSDTSAQQIIDDAKADKRYYLSKSSTIKKERKQKGEIVDEWYRVTLTKIFDDEKEPCGEAEISYKIGAF